ncbi:MAG TPA: hypothetical protein DDY70_07325 [Clostridiales bacterium]|nr:hypothetical protein [Clostridiales bacterium]
MRRTKIIIWSVVSVLILGLLIALLFLPGIGPITFPTGGIYRYANAADYTARGKEFSADDLHALDIDWIDGAVEILPSEDGKIHVEESSSFSLEEAEKQVHTCVSDGTLFVRYAASGKRAPALRKTLTVRIPEGLSLRSASVSAVSAPLKLSSLSAEKAVFSTTSGTIRLENIRATTLVADTTSGGMTISGVSTETLELETTSGGMTVSDVSTETLKLDSTSGAMTLTGIVTKTLTADSTSASLRFEGEAETITADTTSGSVRLTPSTKSLREIRVESTSGDVTVTLPADAGFSASLDSMSGRFSGEFDARLTDGEYVCGDGKIHITVETNSGNLRIERKK